MEVKNSLLVEVEAYVTNFIQEKVPEVYAYHNLDHTQNVVNSAMQIAEKLDLSEKEKEILKLAAWFHDTGYDKGPKDHEQRSGLYAKDYLKALNYPDTDIQRIQECIMATKLSNQPKNLLEEILVDADLSHLGQKIYWDRCSRVRQEMSLVNKKIMSDQAWVDFELDFLQKHEYHTPVAQSLFDKRKTKNILQLAKQKQRLNPDKIIFLDADKKDIGKKKKKKRKKNVEIAPGEQFEIKDLDLGRGVETMYRTTYRTHVNLSSIADNKANIMLSINAIIISITVSTLIPRLETNQTLIIPTFILLGTCLLSIIFATLSTRPKITEGKFTREDIENKKSNLLFFGNFYNMKLDDFQWGMREMIKDSDFLYSSMTRDIYYLGIVLAKKYRYLRVCYGIFMYGLILTVLAFAITLLK